MTPIAPHITVFLQQYLPVERGASVNTCESYAYAFKLFFEYASNSLKVTPSKLQLEQLDAPLVVNFLNTLETARSNGPNSRNIRLAAIKSFMHFMEYRVPTALEQIRRILAIPSKKTDTRLVESQRIHEQDKYRPEHRKSTECIGPAVARDMPPYPAQLIKIGDPPLPTSLRRVGLHLTGRRSILRGISHHCSSSTLPSVSPPAGPLPLCPGNIYLNRKRHSNQLISTRQADCRVIL